MLLSLWREVMQLLVFQLLYGAFPPVRTPHPEEEANNSGTTPDQVVLGRLGVGRCLLWLGRAAGRRRWVSAVPHRRSSLSLNTQVSIPNNKTPGIFETNTISIKSAFTVVVCAR